MLHVAAFNGHLDQIPAALLTGEALREETSAGDTVFHAAAISGHLEQVPAELLVYENLSIPSKTGFTAIHAAAETGQLGKIPPERLTSELMMTRNDNGDTPLHAAAFEGHLDQVPAALLTRERVGDAQLRRDLGGIAGGREGLRVPDPGGGAAKVVRADVALHPQTQQDAVAVLTRRRPRRFRERG